MSAIKQLPKIGDRAVCEDCGATVTVRKVGEGSFFNGREGQPFLGWVKPVRNGLYCGGTTRSRTRYHLVGGSRQAWFG